MRKLLIFAFIGIGAQLVDGTLGMAFGVTSTTLLVLSGVGAAHASAAVHLAEVGTTLASGISHWRFKNVDWVMVAKLGIPGSIGAFAGATVLANLSTKAAIPVTSTILLAIGLYVLLRFALRPGTLQLHRDEATPHGARFLSPLGLFGGFIDASGGGGWGPITTSTLMSRGKTTPRRIVGSVSASEFLVSVSATAGFLVGLGDELFENIAVVVGLLVGGVIAAPIAAWLVSRIAPTTLGVAVGGLIVVTNGVKLLGIGGVAGAWQLAFTAVMVAVVIAFTAHVRRRDRLTAADEAALTGADATTGAGTDAAGTSVTAADDAVEIPTRV